MLGNLYNALKPQSLQQLTEIPLFSLSLPGLEWRSAEWHMKSRGPWLLLVFTKWWPREHLYSYKALVAASRTLLFSNFLLSTTTITEHFLGILAEAFWFQVLALKGFCGNVGQLLSVLTKSNISQFQSGPKDWISRIELQVCLFNSYVGQYLFLPCISLLLNFTSVPPATSAPKGLGTTYSHVLFNNLSAMDYRANGDLDVWEALPLWLCKHADCMSNWNTVKLWKEERSQPLSH